MKLLVTDGVHAGTASAGSDDNCSDEHATGDRPTCSDAMTLTVLAGLDTLITGLMSDKQLAAETLVSLGQW